MRKNNFNTVLVVLITCLVFVNIFIYSNIITDEIPEPEYITDQIQKPADIEQDEKDSLPDNFIYMPMNVSDTKEGPLQLVNQYHAYTFDNIPSVVSEDKSDSIYYNKTSSYSVKDINVSMNLDALSAFNKMMDDFYAVMGNKKTIIVTQGKRTYEDQQAMLELKIEQFGENQTIAQKPGFSEHHTGYAIDISTYENSVMATFTGDGAYSWIPENAHKYGFILRYPEGKEEITGISPESWHYRYVGVPHAQYMYKNSMTLEEYTELLAMYPIDSSMLLVTDETTGENYKIYSAEISVDGTSVAVPKNADSYTISGDNSGHVIITYKEA